MVARLSPLFELAPDAQAFVTFIGATTALFAATIALVQNDIKRIVAYFDLLAARLHVRRHGGGGLFGRHVPPVHPCLLQGVVVPRLGLGDHAMHHEQDIRHMGGLKDRIPFTYAMMVIGRWR